MVVSEDISGNEATRYLHGNFQNHHGNKCKVYISCLESVDWTTGLKYWNGMLDTGMENWNGLNCCKKAFFLYDSFLESGYSLSHFPNFLHAPLLIVGHV